MNNKVNSESKKFSLKGIYKFLAIVLTILFSLFFVNMIIQTLFNNKTATVNFSLPKVLAYTVIYIGLLIGAVVLLRKLTNKKTMLNDRNALLLWIAGALILFCLQIAFAKSYYRMSGWDVDAVLNGAFGLLNGNMELSEYFMQNSNNIFMLMIFKWYLGIVIKLGISDILLATVVLNIVFIDIAIGLIVLICNKLWGKITGGLSLFFSIPILGFTLWMVVPYSDTLSMLFPVLIFYLFLKLEENVTRPFIYIALLGIVSSVGWLLKPTNIIILIAIIIIKMFSCQLNKHSILQFAKTAGIVGAFFILIQGAYQIAREQVVGNFITAQDIKQNENPFTHFLMMGMQKQEIGNGKYSYGAYLWEDVENTLNHVGQKEKRNYNMQVVRQRLEDFGFGGYMKFLYDKANWVCGDGTFYYGGEGEFYITEPPRTGKIGKFIQSFTYLETENFQKYYANILQALWVSVMCFLVVGTVVEIDEFKNVKLAVLRLSIIGILIFILMFEGRSRYLLNYLPLFLLLAVNGLNAFCRLICKREKIELREIKNKEK